MLLFVVEKSEITNMTKYKKKQNLLNKCMTISGISLILFVICFLLYVSNVSERMWIANIGIIIFSTTTILSVVMSMFIWVNINKTITKEEKSLNRLADIRKDISQYVHIANHIEYTDIGVKKVSSTYIIENEDVIKKILNNSAILKNKNILKIFESECNYDKEDLDNALYNLILDSAIKKIIEND